MYQRVQRFGVYGVIKNGDAILLVKKTSEPYVGKWDLPGGIVQFGEAPETTLTREILEETGMSMERFTFLKSDAHVMNYTASTGQKMTLHHVGWIFNVEIKPPFVLSPKSDDDELDQVVWCDLFELDLDEMTPFLQELYFDHMNVRK